MTLGKLLLGLGLGFAALGLVAMGLARLGLHLGRLPGDVVVGGERSTFYFPVVTCIVLSLLLTLFGWLFGRWKP
jgi:hypothetical protein